MNNMKKRYFLKVGENFFENEKIKIIKELERGHRMIIVYLLLLGSAINTRGRIDLFKGTYTISDFIKETEKEDEIYFADIEMTLKKLIELEIVSVIDNKYLIINNYEDMLDYEYVENN